MNKIIIEWFGLLKGCQNLLGLLSLHASISIVYCGMSFNFIAGYV